MPVGYFKPRQRKIWPWRVGRVPRWWKQKPPVAPIGECIILLKRDNEQVVIPTTTEFLARDCWGLH